ncbi:MAG TPA: hypothetical protein DIC19_05290 [Erysipelotrichaceae bacterium]|nr:hypothetical protein [Erysipelotrichaceae bacterium]
MGTIKNIEKKLFNLDRLEERERKRNASGRFNRFGAYFLDHYLQILISSIPVFILWIIANQSIGSNEQIANIDTLPANWQLPAVILVILIMMAYNIILPYYIYEGQTFGKKLIGIKIVKKNGEKASLLNYFIRYLSIMTLEANTYFSAIGGVLFYFLAKQFEFAMKWNNALAIIFVLSAILAALNKERRSIHDFISGTKVINVKETKDVEFFPAAE